MTGTSSPTFLPFPALFFFFFAKICIGSPYWFLIRYWCRFTGAPSSWQIPAMCLRPSATSCKPRLRDVSRDAGACIVQAVPLYTVSAGQGSGETRERERRLLAHSSTASLARLVFYLSLQQERVHDSISLILYLCVFPPRWTKPGTP